MGNADLTKLALIELYKYIQVHNLPVRLIHTVHDEIITECKEEYAEEWKVIMQNIMMEAGKVIVKSIPMKADCHITDFWTKD